MIVKELKRRDAFSENKKVNKFFIKYENILRHFEKHEWPYEVIETVNNDIDDLSTTHLADKDLIKLFKEKANTISRFLIEDAQIRLSEIGYFGMNFELGL